MPYDIRNMPYLRNLRAAKKPMKQTGLSNTASMDFSGRLQDAIGATDQMIDEIEKERPMQRSYNKIGLGKVTVAKGSTATLSWTNKIGTVRVKTLILEAVNSLTGESLPGAVAIVDAKMGESIKLAGDRQPLSVYGPEAVGRPSFRGELPASADVEIKLENLTDATSGVDVVVVGTLVIE